MDFELLDGIAQRLMKKRRAHALRETGSVYYHGARVARGVLALRRMVTADGAHDDLLRCAAMFHDIGKGIEPHARYGEILAREALIGAVAPEELAEVARLIAAHCDRRPDEGVHDVWARLLQDADLLDHVGSYEIWMTCNYYAYQQLPMERMAEFYPDAFEQMVAENRALINFDISRRVFDEKIAFSRAYIKRYLVERTGEYVFSAPNVT